MKDIPDILKFRMYNKSVKRFTYWDKAQITTDYNGVPVVAFYTADGSDIYLSEYCDIQRCTGLRDKNGNLIFEGDIVKSEFNRGTGGNACYIDFVVCWAACGFYIQYADKSKGDTKFIAYDKLIKSEIIGNIHDNPELLNGGVQE
jgi:uncharacterized phage protein (TIGR01671 family)